MALLRLRPGRRVVDDDVGLDPVVGDRQQRDAGLPAVAQRGGDVGERVAGAQHAGADEVGGDVAVAEAEPRRVGAVGGQLVAHRPGLARPAPAALGVDAAAEGVHAGVEVGADAQAVQPDVVADVDHGGDLRRLRDRRQRARPRAGNGLRRRPPTRTVTFTDASHVRRDAGDAVPTGVRGQVSRRGVAAIESTGAWVSGTLGYRATARRRSPTVDAAG